jgi:Fe2+ transport system protein B
MGMAFMLDRVFRMFGLHGSSDMALIVSGGIARETGTWKWSAFSMIFNTTFALTLSILILSGWKCCARFKKRNYFYG